MASLLRSFIAPSTEDTPSGSETVQKLCSRISSSTLIEDRRDALRGIKGMSRDFRREVGDICLNVLLTSINKDRTDPESTGYAIETIHNLVSIEEGEKSTDEVLLAANYAAEVVKNPDNIALILSLIEEFDFQIRRPATRLIAALLYHKLLETQEAILKSPMGISKIMDLLSGSNEIIRNDALLLLLELTRSNSQIQKIIAFENAFERLMAIITEEGLSDGGIVVLDCIRIMQNLLKGNSSNQSFYCEASQIQTLVPFFDLKLSRSVAWNKQKEANIIHMLMLVRTLVSPSNSQQNITTAQKVMHQCRLLSLLCAFMFAAGVPTEVLVESINTVAEVIRGNFTNQQYFDTVQTLSQPPRSGVLTILMCMVNEKQPLQLRLATLYCFQCYLYRNEVGQSKVINTLLPSAAESTVSAGQVICTGIFGTDPLSTWMTAVSLSCALNVSMKPQLLRVQLSMQGKGQVTLMQQCSNILIENSDLATLSRIGLLMLLCTWLYDCPAAVAQFLSSAVNIPFLTGMIEHHYNSEHSKVVGGLCATLVGICLVYNDRKALDYQPETLKQIIEHRIGKETFVQSLTQIASSDFFTLAGKQPQTIATGINQIVFDYSFTIMFKQVSDAILKALDSDTVLTITNSVSPRRNGPESHPSFEEHSSVVQQYKELLQEQDNQISDLKNKCDELERAHKNDQLVIQQQLEQLQLKSTQPMVNGEKADTSLQRVQESLKMELAQKNTQVEKLKQDLQVARESIEQLKENHLSELRDTKEAMKQLEAENEALLTEKNSLDYQLQQAQSQPPVTSTTDSVKIQELQTQLQLQQKAYGELKEKSETIEKEQEDLLVLLADNDVRIKKFKSILTENNIPIPESEEESDEDDDEEI